MSDRSEYVALLRALAKRCGGLLTIEELEDQLRAYDRAVAEMCEEIRGLEVADLEEWFARDS